MNKIIDGIYQMGLNQGETITDMKQMLDILIEITNWPSDDISGDSCMKKTNAIISLNKFNDRIESAQRASEDALLNATNATSDASDAENETARARFLGTSIDIALATKLSVAKKAAAVSQRKAAATKVSEKNVIKNYIQIFNTSDDPLILSYLLNDEIYAAFKLLFETVNNNEYLLNNESIVLNMICVNYNSPEYVLCSGLDSNMNLLLSIIKKIIDIFENINPYIVSGILTKLEVIKKNRILQIDDLYHIIDKCNVIQHDHKSDYVIFFKHFLDIEINNIGSYILYLNREHCYNKKNRLYALYPDPDIINFDNINELYGCETNRIADLRLEELPHDASDLSIIERTVGWLQIENDCYIDTLLFILFSSDYKNQFYNLFIDLGNSITKHSDEFKLINYVYNYIKGIGNKQWSFKPLKSYLKNKILKSCIRILYDTYLEYPYIIDSDAEYIYPILINDYGVSSGMGIFITQAFSKIKLLRVDEDIERVNPFGYHVKFIEDNIINYIEENPNIYGFVIDCKDQSDHVIAYVRKGDDWLCYNNKINGTIKDNAFTKSSQGSSCIFFTYGDK